MTKILIAIVSALVVSTGGVFAYQAITSNSSKDEVEASTKEDQKHEEKKKEATTKKNANSKETVDPNINLLTSYYTELHFGEPIETLVELYGEPIEKTASNISTAMEYSDATYHVGRLMGVTGVEINGDKAAQIVKDFDAVDAMYFPDDVYAAYEEERDHLYSDYRLVLTSYGKQAIFYSENEDGNPIKKITIQESEAFN